MQSYGRILYSVHLFRLISSKNLPFYNFKIPLGNNEIIKIEIQGPIKLTAMRGKSFEMDSFSKSPKFLTPVLARKTLKLL